MLIELAPYLVVPVRSYGMDGMNDAMCMHDATSREGGICLLDDSVDERSAIYHSHSQQASIPRTQRWLFVPRMILAK